MARKGLVIGALLLWALSVSHAQRSNSRDSIRDGDVVAIQRRFTFSPSKSAKRCKLMVAIPQSLPLRQEVLTVLYNFKPDREFSENGQGYAEWDFADLKSEFDLSVVYVVRLYRYDLTVARNRGRRESGSAEDLSLFLEDEKELQINDLVVREAAEGIPRGKDRLETIANIHDFVTNRLEYRLHHDNDRTAVHAIKNGHGKCHDYALTFVALCRARGIPARLVTGYTNAGGDTGHGWVEVHTEEYGWVPFDPTWNDQKGEPCGVLKNAYLIMNRMTQNKTLRGGGFHGISQHQGRTKLEHTTDLLFGGRISPLVAKDAEQGGSETSRLVRPLVETSWGKLGDDPPDEGRISYGPWAYAMAQILYYHRRQPTGRVSYRSGEYRVKKDFDSHKFNWDLFVNDIKVDTPKESTDEVYKYVSWTNYAMRREVGVAKYALGRFERPGVIGRHFGCAIRVYVSDKYPLKKMEEVIQEELNARRPVFLEVARKTPKAYQPAVIDGYRVRDGRFEVHVNIGPRGKGNGYYDFSGPILDYDDNTYRFIATIRPPGGYKRVDPVKSKVSTARAYLSAGLKDKARTILRDVLENHADSEHAEEAKELLKSLE